MSPHSRTRAFTLIEILVVVSIIGVLSAVILTSLNSARIKGRDAARIVDVREIKKAMEFYYDDNKSYPKAGNIGAAGAVANLEPYLVTPKYISTIAPGLTTDGDLYAWRNATLTPANPADSYAIIVTTEAGGVCKTGAGPNVPQLFPSVTTLCNF
jgi:prepilin-type N-terminal cleavage/methylation domain-containing protein